VGKSTQMILCLKTGNVAKLVVNFHISFRKELATYTPLLQCDLKSLYACLPLPLAAQNSKKSGKLISTRQTIL